MKLLVSLALSILSFLSKFYVQIEYHVSPHMWSRQRPIVQSQQDLSWTSEEIKGMLEAFNDKYVFINKENLGLEIGSMLLMMWTQKMP